MSIDWSNHDGHTYGYPEGFEIEITPRTPYRAGYQMESNVRHWTIFDENNTVIASGTAEGLRASKKAVAAALASHLAH